MIRDIQEPQPDGTKIDKETFKIVKEGMRRVTNGAAGTARSLKIPGVQMAGKTGTAQVMSFSADQIYSQCESRPIQTRHHGWFIAWAPWDKPEITVAVLAQHSCHGNSGAGVVVRDIMEAYFKKYHPELVAEALKKKETRAKVITPVTNEAD